MPLTRCRLHCILQNWRSNGRQLHYKRFLLSRRQLHYARKNQQLRDLTVLNHNLWCGLNTGQTAQTEHTSRHVVPEQKYSGLFGFLTSSSTTRLCRGRAPRTERLTISRAATHESELGNRDFCLCRSHYTPEQLEVLKFSNSRLKFCDASNVLGCDLQIKRAWWQTKDENNEPKK